MANRTTLKCAQCGVVVERTRRTQRYCSKDCRLPNRPHVCLACGRDMTGQNRNYCSDECRAVRVERRSARAAERRRSSPDRTCFDCGTTHRQTGKRCFRCTTLRSSTPTECAWCGTTFPAHPKTGTTYCSARCCNIATSGGKTCDLDWKHCTCGAWFAQRPGRRWCTPDCKPAPVGYVSVIGAPIDRTCMDCGMTWVGERRAGAAQRRCDECQAAATKEQRRAERHRRRAAKRGADSEKFLATEIHDRDLWTCQLCGKRMSKTQAVPHPDAATIDHIIPISVGGTHTRANVQSAHFMCNSIKGARPAGEQLRLVG